MSFFLVQCGEGGDGDAKEQVDLGNVVDLDLSEYGYNIIVNVPAPSQTMPEATVDVNDWGAVEIRVGTNFQIQIGGGEGDIAAEKAHVLDDAVYEATFIIDEPDGILYSRKINGTDLEPEYHFLVIIMDGANPYEIRGIEGEVFKEKAAKRMFDIAKAIEIKEAS